MHQFRAVSRSSFRSATCAVSIRLLFYMVKKWAIGCDRVNERALMPPRKSPDLSAKGQSQDAPAKIERFKALARELGCDKDEAAFEAALKKVAESGPAPKHEPKKRAPKGT